MNNMSGCKGLKVFRYHERVPNLTNDSAELPLPRSTHVFLQSRQRVNKP